MSIDFDSVTEGDLREAGSVKWTMFPDAIGAFVAEMDFGLAPPIRAALEAALDSGLTGYLPARLANDLARAASDWYAESYGWHVAPDRIHHLPDVIAAFELSITHFTRPDAAVIVPTPAYMPFLLVPPMLGRRVIEVPSVEIDGRWVIDHKGVRAAFEGGGELLVVCNPHNPLGTVATRAELEQTADTVTAGGGRVFSDEIHAPIVYGSARHIPYASISEAAASHTITATSASKAWNLAGLKCAQVILSNDHDAVLWDAIAKWAGHGTSTLGVIANTAAYSAGRGWLDMVVDYLDGNRNLLAELVEEHLPDVRLVMPEGTYVALLDFRRTGIDGDLGAWFRDNAGVAMTDGAECGEAGAGFTRFVFAMPRPVLREAVVRIGKALERREALVRARDREPR